MTLTISLPPDVEAKLRDKAAAAGQPLDAYAAHMLERAASVRWIDELLAPVRQQAAASGLSDDDLMSLGRAALLKVREERKASVP